VVTEKQMEGLAFLGTQEEWRRIAHKISDAIYKRVTGEEGYFDTKIVYVSQVGPSKKRVKRLAIMDQDGAGHRYLTSGQSIVLTPRFAPNLHQITYLDFQSGRPRVWIMNTGTQKKELVGNFPGMTFAPRFSPDGQNMVMSFAKDGNTSLYAFNLATREAKRLTSGPVIDTSPSYSPDGSQICFNSDRGGRTQIYVMDKDGGNAQRISFGDGSYRTPVWSPRGDLIAFTKITDGAFYIGVMKPDGSGERLLAKGWVVEDPCWSPNGRVLMFTRQDRSGGSSRVYTIDLTGNNERLVETPTDGAGASWSPLIP
jgi:TolB protein